MSDEELRSVLADFIKECLNEISVKRASSGNEGENEIKVLNRILFISNVILWGIALILYSNLSVGRFARGRCS